MDGRKNICEIEVAKGKALPQSSVGDVWPIPLSLSYAVTIHKGQGLTIKRVDAVLEGMFAHGQAYVQNSRTPLERNFMRVGVPPIDLLPEVLKAVMHKQTETHKLFHWLLAAALDERHALVLDVVRRSHQRPQVLEANGDENDAAQLQKIHDILYQRFLCGEDDDLRNQAAGGSVKETTTKDEISDNSSAKLVDRVRIELDTERRRLDVHQGR